MTQNIRGGFRRKQTPWLIALAALSMGVANMASAQESLSTKSRTHLLSSQLEVLDNRAAQQYNSSVRLAPNTWDVPPLDDLGLGLGPVDSYQGPYRTMAEQAARRHGIPVNLFLRLVRQESGWNPKALSPKGAIGLAQLMPQTARYLRVNPRDPAANLEGGARYLKEQYRTFGSWRLALAAYNAGPGAVKRYGGVPPFKETRNYVKVILGG